MSVEQRLLPEARTRSAGTIGFLKRVGLAPALLCLALLAGCAHRYDVVLTNGERITNVTKPVLDRQNGVFNYKDVAGHDHHVSAGRVLDIGPHSNKNTTPGTLQYQKGSQ
jgi:hypothetical protein